MMGTNDLLRRVISLSSRHGYIYQSKELRPPSGVSGCYDYGPLGVELRRNLINEWWMDMVSSQEDIVGVESSALHSSPTQGQPPSPGTSHDVLCVSHSENNGTSCQDKTTFLQSSLHQGIFSHYYNTLCLLNRRLPFGLAQIGPCFRTRSSQQSPADFIHNALQTTELSMQFFCAPKTSNLWYDDWQRDRLLWWRKFAGLPSDFTATDVSTTGHVQSADIQYTFPWGVETLERISNHGSTPVDQLQASLKADLQGKDGRRLVTPHLIETTSCLETGLLAYLLDAHQEKTRTDTRGAAVTRQILRLHLRLAPVKVIVLPIRGTRELREISSYLSKEFRKAAINIQCIIEVSPSLEKYYTLFDEMGVPFTILLNENTLKTGILRVRHRDTTLMQQLHITEVREMIQRHLEAD